MAFSSSGNAWLQRQISLKSRKRGCHYVTDEILHSLGEISKIKYGILHLYELGPIGKSDSYKHSCEGPDDMPAHAKQALLGGPSISVPISNGKLCLGTWQGIWLCEHRNSASSRHVIATINGCLNE